MNNVAAEQKQLFLELAGKYGSEVLAIAQRGLGNEILIQSAKDVRALENFANHICSSVLKDHPDYEGADEGINADAALAANIVPRLIYEFLHSRSSN